MVVRCDIYDIVWIISIISIIYKNIVFDKWCIFDMWVDMYEKYFFYWVWYILNIEYGK